MLLLYLFQSGFLVFTDKRIYYTVVKNITIIYLQKVKRLCASRYYHFMWFPFTLQEGQRNKYFPISNKPIRFQLTVSHNEDIKV